MSSKTIHEQKMLIIIQNKEKNHNQDAWNVGQVIPSIK